MVLKVTGRAVFLVTLLCALAPGNSGGWRTPWDRFFNDVRDSSALLVIKENTMEESWIYCKNELMQRAIANRDIGLHSLVEVAYGRKSSSLTETNFEETISILPLQLKVSLLECLRSHDPRQNRFEEEKVLAKKWFLDVIQFVINWGRDVPRRYLLKRKSTDTIAIGPSPSSGSNMMHHKARRGGSRSMFPGHNMVRQKARRGGSPLMFPGHSMVRHKARRGGHAPAPSPAWNIVPGPSPSPGTESPHSPSPAPSPDLNFNAGLPKEESNAPFAREPLKSQPNDVNTAGNLQHTPFHEWVKMVMIAIGSAAITVLLLALFVALCIKPKKRNDPKVMPKDNGPLLKLTSDFSAGSSQGSLSMDSSSNKDVSSSFGRTSSITTISIVSENPKSPRPEMTSSETAEPAPALQASLKPPPGKPVPPLPGLPPPSQPRPPPPPKGSRPPPAPPPKIGLHGRGNRALTDGYDSNGDSEAPKTKLKPFFWDKVLASPDRSMVWHEIKSGSFQFNEEMIESLFGYTTNKNKMDNNKESPSRDAPPQYIQIIDPKKAQNLSILLRALNLTTEEVCDALTEGNELPLELLQTLLKATPSTDEELKLRMYTGDPSKLGPAERFLKVLVEIPFAFKRVDALLFMTDAEEEESNVRESLKTLEVACSKLRESRLFLKLLEAVLKTGNRMNDGTFRGGAQAFRLDTLLKLSDVRGTDGKTTLLHFVVQEIIRTEGIRAARTIREIQSMSSAKSEDFIDDLNQESADHYHTLGLAIVSGLSTELEDVKRAAIIDADNVSASVSKLNQSLRKTKEFLSSELKGVEEGKFCNCIESFVDDMESKVTSLQEDEKRMSELVESTAAYFHGSAGKSEGFRLFAIIRDFLVMLDKVCKEIKDSRIKENSRTARKDSNASSPSPDNCQTSPDIQQRLFPAIVERQKYTSSSDDESPSP